MRFAVIRLRKMGQDMADMIVFAVVCSDRLRFDLFRFGRCDYLRSVTFCRDPIRYGR